MRKEELHFVTYFLAKQTTKNRKEVFRLAFCDVLRRNKHAPNTCIMAIMMRIAILLSGYGELI